MRGPAVRLICHSRAANPRSSSATAATSSSSGGRHASRRTASGCSRFSAGNRCSSASAATTALAAASRSAAARSRSAQRCAGGGPSLGRVVSGNSCVGQPGGFVDRVPPLAEVAAAATAVEVARRREVTRAGRRLRRHRQDRRVGQQPARRDVGLAGDAVAGQPHRAHDRQLPAVAHLVNARRPAANGRARQRQRVRCARVRTPRAPTPTCPGARVRSRARRAARSAARRRERRSAATVRAAAVATSRRPSGPSPSASPAGSRPWWRARPADSRPTGRRARCRTASAGHAEVGQAGQVLVRGVHDPLGVAERGGDRRQVGAADRVDQQDAGALAAQLHEVGAMAVAIARRALGVDGQRAGSGGKPGYRVAQRLVVVDDRADAVAQLEQRRKNDGDAGVPAPGRRLPRSARRSSAAAWAGVPVASGSGVSTSGCRLQAFGIVRRHHGLEEDRGNGRTRRGRAGRRHVGHVTTVRLPGTARLDGPTRHLRDVMQRGAFPGGRRPLLARRARG